MNKLLYIAILALFTSCVTKQKCLDKFGTPESSYHTDSIVITERVEHRDTVVKVVADTSYVQVDQPCDTDGVLKTFDVLAKGPHDRAVARVKGTDDRLEVECLCEEEKAIIRRYKVAVDKLRQHVSTGETVQTITEKHVPWYAKWWMLLLMLASGYLLGRFRLDRALIRTLFNI